MDKVRVIGSAKETEGETKGVIGKAVGAPKVEAAGKTARAAEKIRNAIGGLKNVLKRR